MSGLLAAVLGWSASVLVLLLMVPVGVFALQVFAARLGRAGDRVSPADDAVRPRLAVLVPAHNESGGIAATLATVSPQLKAGDRLLVVADNCSDDTAEAARACGAEVVERQHATLRGKGYALDFGMQHLRADPPEVLVIVDADCTLGPRALQHLARACSDSGRPVQGLYLMHAPADAPLRMRVAAFAWRVKNWLRPLGALRIGAPCPLMGTGMAFPWPLIGRMSLASGHLVEDMKLGIDLANAGAPPLFVPEAQIDSVFPLTTESAQAQRARWEHGHIATLLHDGPRLLGQALARRDPRLVAMALDLMVPPLTLLLGLVLLAVLLGALLWAFGLSALPLCIAGSGLVLMSAALLRAWWQVGRPVLSAEDLLRAPLYALWKIPLYLKFVTHRQKEWVRTERHDEKP